ncbi:hypothetical protein [Streptomyces sp. NPDC048269]|uniref:baeRF2 domain-containing protein n=1 Tax=Streptomyces sp. NPDC048269 TaxID=3155753 RepID=UPI0034299A5A
MKLQFLHPLYAHPGPIASVYLDTSRDVDDPDRAIDRRWRKLRESLLAHDADEPTVRAIEEAVGTDREVAGRHGRAVFAAHGSLVLAETLPEPPAHDSALYGMLPDALPLALQHTPDIPYAAVVTRRRHIAGPGGKEELELEYEAGRWPMNRVAPDEYSHRRVPVEAWPEEAGRFLAELADSVDTNGVEMIVLSGDPWAVNSLMRSAPRKLHGALVKLKDGRHGRAAPGRALLEDELGILLDDRLPDHDKKQLDAFLGQRARHPEYVEGIAATVAALQREQAQTLILDRPVEPDRHLWVGTASTHLALSGEDLSAFGLHYFWEEPAVGAALIRAAAGTQADLIAVPRDELPLEDGAAVLLRYTGT